MGGSRVRRRTDGMMEMIVIKVDWDVFSVDVCAQNLCCVLPARS
jgi:hypothetical protein